jgi:hypothetical protein
VRVAGIVVGILVAMTGAIRATAVGLPEGCGGDAPLEGVVFGFDFTEPGGIATRYTEQGEHACEDIAERELARSSFVVVAGVGAAFAIRRWATAT